MEANIPSTDQGSSQGSHLNTDIPLDNDINLLQKSLSAPQGPMQSVAARSGQTVEDDTMKIAPIKATAIIRKRNSKELHSALFRRRFSEEVGTSHYRNIDSSTVLNSKKFATTPGAGRAALCSSLPEDLICKVTSFLDVRSLLQVRKCSRYLRQLASRNEAGWECLCRRLWARKVHVPSIPATGGLTPNHFMQAYHTSIHDAQERQNLTMEELCYDPQSRTGTIWSFRFKESAGADWTTADPWHCGLPCRKMVLLKDGSVRQYIPSAAAVSSISSSANSDTTSSAASDSESSLPELVSPNFGNLLEQQQPPNNNLQPPNNGRLIPPPLSMSWRLLTRPMDLPTRPVGSYVRFSVGGREVPTYSVRRSPTGNWGFVMESCWGLYASFELPPKQQPPAQNARRRLRRTETGAQWVLESGDEESNATTQPQNDAALMDDASLVITNEIQWREAFLYNVGARVLPEGDDATGEFDRAFRGMP